MIVPNPVLRHRVNRGLNTDEVAEPNVFAAIAPVAAFNHGAEWLDSLREYLWENRRYAEEFITKEIKGSHIPALAGLPRSNRRCNQILRLHPPAQRTLRMRWQ